MRKPDKHSYLVFYPQGSYIIPIGIYIWYFMYYAYKNKGQTLGKKWNKIRIVRLDGNNLSFGHFVIREGVKLGMLIVAPILFGYLGVLIWLSTYLLALTKNRRALHDIIAGTQVIKVKL